MYDTFAADLEKSNTDESALQKAFEDHIAAKEKANADMKREILQKEEQSAQKSSELSEAEATLSATTEQKSSDESIFESTRESCKVQPLQQQAQSLARAWSRTKTCARREAEEV